MKSDEAWNNLKEKFTSANRIPVERSNITHEEYEAIKDDRDLLEEAKGVLEKIYDKRFSVVAFLDYNEIKDFLARAKERLG